MLGLRSFSSQQWLDTVLGDFDAFLLDHAACERKASATAMGLVVHYPDRGELVRAMIDLAREELDHFAQVYEHIAQRGLVLAPDRKDAYVRRLLAQARHGRDAYFLDRLLIAGIVEARGCERFGRVAAALPAGDMQQMYDDITRSESRHHGLFVRLAKTYFAAPQVDERLAELLETEAQIIVSLPARAALH